MDNGISIGFDNHYFWPSHIFDGLQQLIEKTVFLNTEISDVEISFFDEPREYRIFIQHLKFNIQNNFIYAHF